ncbi:TetR/AcrR family transcriptional regulator [Robertkochia aurantiaca]|uniref:TetR/AcrR family transcriptional regulator n=1 Tax=Robertkochia aurantiaca TaxID=2873700 RepID=UPI001CCF7608|nr:TetR/AcrR family transcriptional regulator [Robertkochia sp. 3YJGBD-33]
MIKEQIHLHDLDKIMNLFWEKGYKSVSREDLAEIIGDEGSHHTKKTLFKLAFQHYLKINYNFIQTFLDNQRSVKEGLSQLMILGAEEAISDPKSKGCLVVNSIVEMTPADDEMMMQFLENKIFVENIFKEYLKRGIENGELRKDLDLTSVAACLYNNYSGLKIIAKVQKDRKAIYEMIRTSMKVLD